MPKQHKPRPLSDFIEVSKRHPIVTPDPKPPRQRAEPPIRRESPQALRTLSLPYSPRMDYRLEQRARFLQDNPGLIEQAEIRQPLAEGPYARRRREAQAHVEAEPEHKEPRSSRPEPEQTPFDALLKRSVPLPPKYDPSLVMRALGKTHPYVRYNKD